MCRNISNIKHFQFKTFTEFLFCARNLLNRIPFIRNKNNVYYLKRSIKIVNIDSDITDKKFTVKLELEPDLWHQTYEIYMKKIINGM